MEIYTRLGTFDLSKLYNKSVRPRPGRIESEQQTAGGYTYDLFHGDDVPPGVQTVRIEGEVISEDAADFVAQMAVLKGMRNRVEVLRRRRIGGKSIQAANVRVGFEEGKRIMYAQRVTLNCVLLDPGFYGMRRGQKPVWGAGHKWGDGWIWGGDVRSVSFADGTTTLDNTGDRTALWPVVTISAETDLVNPRIQLGDADIQYMGTVLAGTDLVIDCGTPTATNDGVEVNITLNAAHGLDEWLLVPVGAPVVTVSADSGTGSAAFQYRERWEL